MSNLEQLQSFGYRLKAGYSDRKVGEKVFLLGPDGVMHILENLPATTLWGGIAKGELVQVEDLTSLIAGKFEVSREIARSDVLEFLEHLGQLGVVERITPGVAG